MTTIGVYGAGGYTGRLVAAEVARRGLGSVLVGRTMARLEAAASEAGGETTLRQAAVDDEAALRRAFEGCDAVINCAGPFTPIGHHVVAAAIDVGAHYVDTTGEQPFMRRVLEEWDGKARAAGIAAVPGMGFDYLPGDLIAHLAAQGHEPLRDMIVAYAVRGMRPTRGTAHSALLMMSGKDLVYEDGVLRPGGRPPLRASFDFPSPLGRKAVARYPAGEVLTVPRHVKARNVTALLTADTIAPVGRAAPAVLALTAASAPLLRTPLRGLLDRGIERLPEGPAERDRRAAAYTIVAEAHGEDGRIGRAVVSGTDVYGITAVTTVHGAATLAAGGGTGQVGALAPAQAFHAADFLDHLGEHGVSYAVDSPRVPVSS